MPKSPLTKKELFELLREQIVHVRIMASGSRIL